MVSHSLIRKTGPRIGLAAGVLGSLALFPLAAVQGTVTRSRMPPLPPAEPPHRGWVAGKGRSLRVIAIGDSAISGVGVARGDETVSATTARALARLTGRPVHWRAIGLSGATASRAMKHLVPRIASEPADLIIVAFGVNDVVAYRSPSAFANTLAALVTAARARVGDAAVVIAGVAPLALFPGLPWPLRTILGWRCAAPFPLDLFAGDGFHPNARAHSLWGEEIAALALPLLADCGRSRDRHRSNRMLELATA